MTTLASWQAVMAALLFAVAERVAEVWTVDLQMAEEPGVVEVAMVTAVSAAGMVAGTAVVIGMRSSFPHDSHTCRSGNGRH